MVLHALQAEKGNDVRCIELTGRSDLAHGMIFVTSRSVPQMRKLAKMVVKAVTVRPRTGSAYSVATRK